MIVGEKRGFYEAIKYFLNSVAFNLPLYEGYLIIDLWYVTNSLHRQGGDCTSSTRRYMSY